MSFFAINLVLAFVWGALSGMSLPNLLLGFAIGFLALALSQRFIRSGDYIRSSGAALRLLVLFFKELVIANLRLARDVLRRDPRFSPAFLRVDVSNLRPWQTTTLAALVSLTPGSITIDVTRSGHALVFHTLYARQPEQARQSVCAFAAILVRIGSRAPEPGSRR